MKRPYLLPLVPLYASAVALNDHLYARGFRRPRSLEYPVISIGSLSAGGAGKTPAVLLLAELLAELHYAPDILTRGYGRSSTSIERVDPTGPTRFGDKPGRYGDEPIMLAQRTGLPVYVGANRHAAGLLAERESPSPARIHLLDDGFQHRRLARALDIVLLTAEDLADHLLPAGNLREPLAALARACILILREDEPHLTPDFVRHLVFASQDPSPRQRSRPHSPPDVWIVRRTLTLPEPLPTRSIAFCGIARPAGFLKMLASAGPPPAAHLDFPDHHPYTDADIDRLLALARPHAAQSFVTTEKDAVKLTPAMRARLEAVGPLMIARLDLDFADFARRQQALDDLTRLLKRTQPNPAAQRPK